MRRRRLTSWSIAVQNLKLRPKRTFCMVSFVALLSFVVSGGSLFSYSLLNGARSMSARLGADALFVPLGYEKNAEGALLRGEPSTFYFSGELSGRLARAEGVARASPQLFIASFNSSHCAFPAQLIGYAPETDFTIGPWLAEQTTGGLSDGEVVVGSLVNRKKGDDITFFGQTYRVAGRLDKTGMGFDTSIFLNMNTARAALKDYSKYAEKPVPGAGDAVSSITVDIKSGVDHSKFARDVRESFRGDLVGVILTQALIDGVSKDLGAFIPIAGVLMAALWVSSAGVLAILFTVAFNERRREFCVYRVLGATRGKLRRIILLESCAVSAAGAAAGVFSLCFFVLPFTPLIGRTIGTAYLQPSPEVLSAILLAALLVSFVTGPMASINSAAAIGRLSACEALKEV
jgi:putative ABC transport system permease protein